MYEVFSSLTCNHAAKKLQSHGWSNVGRQWDDLDELGFHSFGE